GTFESLFRQAVDAIDAGDADRLEKMLNAHPHLVRERLRSPGAWLRDQIGDALDSFFKDPYLLWFVSEDAVRNKALPPNIAVIADIIIQKIKAGKTTSLREQLDYTLKLVALSWVARECKVQIALMEVLIDEGAATDGVSNDALVNGNFEAAKYLLSRGAKPDLPTALCLERWKEADELAQSASPEQKQFSLILAALNGKAKAVTRVIGYGEVDINKPNKHLYSHATALHHAVWSGSIETVKVLVGAGAKLDIKDTIYDGTPLGWAEYGNKNDIAGYLKQIRPNES
ncbi:MAG TPA: ankyrin repeat domain-containing protein, partial [Chitinophagaceae bacterium]|nr:ankyrin repeat domain-containing protein [Chitinophagaceae bacterium]